MTYTYTPLEDFVRDLYHKLNMFVPTDIDMVYIAEQFKVKLHFYDDGSTAVENGEELHMFIDERLTPQEQWQDFAHELCHLIRHNGNQLWLSTKLSTDYIKLQESQAENFMYHFCVPSFMLLDYQVIDFHTLNEGVPFVSNVFNVTDEFAKKRLIMFLNQIQQAQLDELHRKQMEALYPKAPPYSAETNQILAKLYHQLANKHKEAPVYAPAKTIS
ncbi:ImmA/IrrE family metallo-endopeptidase [Cytobacillus spongiae]|uniref:ImmA/IrrE family metallo-endopeptidase n=1 Tax=Cytobacillus spongiae TaxID=2901381 RepID=UPI001F2DD6FF|nr:ImmA/IrrE family metallo-endopeptidase [Cytobacillus spongiae]UII56674.1 ImmA/IrrE family metallo-endopeptidase [Cytobacillus spongiae]